MGLDEKTRLIVSYLIENREAFTDMEKRIILDNISEPYEGCSVPNIVQQLYDELGILPDAKNPYKAFAKLIDEKFDIKDKRVVEIGGGTLPRLGKRIASMQDRGSITVYDPNLYLKSGDIHNLKLIKRKFYPISNVDLADVLVGLLPCGSSSTIVKSAIKHNKDFMIALCDSCNYLEFFDGCEEDIDWPFNFIKQTSAIVKENHLGKLKVKYLNEVGKQYPIIYNDRG
jgi:hypothetical protein